MQVQFNRPATIAGVTYGKGVHNIEHDLSDDWFFVALIVGGDVVILHPDAETVKIAEPIEASCSHRRNIPGGSVELLSQESRPCSTGMPTARN